MSRPRRLMRAVNKADTPGLFAAFPTLQAAVARSSDIGYIFQISLYRNKATSQNVPSNC